MTGPSGSPPQAQVIEDDEHLARLVPGYLAAANTAEVALDGERGLECARAPLPDVVALDLIRSAGLLRPGPAGWLGNVASQPGGGAAGYGVSSITRS